MRSFRGGTRSPSVALRSAIDGGNVAGTASLPVCLVPAGHEADAFVCRPLKSNPEYNSHPSEERENPDVLP